MILNIIWYLKKWKIMCIGSSQIIYHFEPVNICFTLENDIAIFLRYIWFHRAIFFLKIYDTTQAH